MSLEGDRGTWGRQRSQGATGHGPLLGRSSPGLPHVRQIPPLQVPVCPQSSPRTQKLWGRLHQVPLVQIWPTFPTTRAGEGPLEGWHPPSPPSWSGSHAQHCPRTHSQRITPSFSPFWKSGPICFPVTLSIHVRSSASFCGSYFWASWGGSGGTAQAGPQSAPQTPHGDSSPLPGMGTGTGARG